MPNNDWVLGVSRVVTVALYHKLVYAIPIAIYRPPFLLKYFEAL